MWVYGRQNSKTAPQVSPFSGSTPCKVGRVCEYDGIATPSMKLHCIRCFISRNGRDWFTVGLGIFCLFVIFIYFAVPSLSCRSWDLQLQHAGSSFLIRDWTYDPCIGSPDSQPLDHWGSLHYWFWRSKLSHCEKAIYLRPAGGEQKQKTTSGQWPARNRVFSSIPLKGLSSINNLNEPGIEPWASDEHITPENTFVSA